MPSDWLNRASYLHATEAVLVPHPPFHDHRYRDWSRFYLRAVRLDRHCRPGGPGGDYEETIGVSAGRNPGAVARPLVPGDGAAALYASADCRALADGEGAAFLYPDPVLRLGPGRCDRGQRRERSHPFGGSAAGED